MNPIPVLFDTDIGTNIDDALALALLLRDSRCNLLGITTVSGAVERRAACAQAVCSAAGREDVPIHCGAASPLLLGPGQPDVPRFDGLARAPAREFTANGSAIEFLRKTIRSSPQPVVLLSTGPLTNIALLFCLDPEIPGLLRNFVCMAGVFAPREGQVETNCRLDPLAAAIVFEQWRRAFSVAMPRCKPSVSIGLDVTTRCTMPAAEVRRKLAAGPAPLRAIGQMADAWLAARESVVFHDPLAAACLFRPSLCGYADGIVAVDGVPGSPTAGMTHFMPKAGGCHRVATSINAAVFFREFFSLFE